MEKNRFLDKLGKLVDWEDTNAKKLAREAGVGYDVVREIVRGRTKSISVDNAKPILDMLGLSFEQVYGENHNSGFAETPTRTIRVPRYKAQLSAGHGAANLNQEQIVDYIPFTPEFLSKKLGRKAVDGLVVCDVKGDSMQPTIGDGDLAMVNTEFDSKKSGLYAVNYADETLVKRVEPIGDGYHLISDNNLYPTIKVQGPDLEKFKIIGEVIWISRTL